MTLDVSQVAELLVNHQGFSNKAGRVGVGLQVKGRYPRKDCEPKPRLVAKCSSQNEGDHFMETFSQALQASF